MVQTGCPIDQIKSGKQRFVSDRPSVQPDELLTNNEKASGYAELAARRECEISNKICAGHNSLATLARSAGILEAKRGSSHSIQSIQISHLISSFGQVQFRDSKGTVVGSKDFSLDKLSFIFEGIREEKISGE